jgi:hypothetical protein
MNGEVIGFHKEAGTCTVKDFRLYPHSLAGRKPGNKAMKEIYQKI